MEHCESSRNRRASRKIYPAAFDIVAIASSAGDLKALIRVLSQLPADFPKAITIVQDLDTQHGSLNPHILLTKICEIGYILDASASARLWATKTIFKRS